MYQTSEIQDQTSRKKSHQTYVIFVALLFVVGAAAIPLYLDIWLNWLWLSVGLFVFLYFQFAQNQHETTDKESELHTMQRQLQNLIEQKDSEISELKSQLVTVNEKQVLYNTVLDLIPDWIYVKDTQHNYIYANRSFLKAIPQLELGKSDDIFMPPDFCEKAWADEKAVMHKKMHFQDIEEQAGDVWLATTKVQWTEAKTGQLNGIIGITRNVTPHVHNRQTIENNNRLISEKVERVYEIQADTQKAGKRSKDCYQVFSNLSEIITDINTKNDLIGETVELIQGLASQSKLLSINAAIEAAKAGDSGRGFGVVAHEVRELAERSEQAVSEIKAAINASTDVIGSGNRMMTDVSQSFNQTIENFQTIAHNLDELSDDLSKI
ncbi:methyl-accepting chemotaxis protein [Catenovulum sediminis]|uniref:methyl-accepting chemotaxis protein n=1 Tax=Catenovulum sediminis TaxID=1740262 RepID=UPI0011812C07|nr:methyl-accepting chemotaxis protein [Catenovulum sediminis]